MPATDRDPMLLEHLNFHPLLRARVESLLEVVEDAAGDCEKADAAGTAGDRRTAPDG